MDSDLDIAFKEAFDKIWAFKKTLAPDVMLKFYAYNKQATFGSNFSFEGNENVRSAFKANAWMQLKGMSSDEAKKEYIKLAKLVLNNNK